MKPYADSSSIASLLLREPGLFPTGDQRQAKLAQAAGMHARLVRDA
jgi:hypothetical protein